ncbi:MAG: cob(I)yrinic acid a,c-diamide adenosyltransferase [Crocinitomicaceae bacterium]|nr:cob(I)yrinic acid a,c-diamide adenosyltransferase [Crocinitomicaceae bacterium]
MKIYTRKGDKGETGLIGGDRILKNALQIECYGTIDELNSYLGLLRCQINDNNSHSQLIDIQETLFTIGSHLACAPEYDKTKLPQIKTKEITKLEDWMDQMDQNLEPLRFFTLPGANVLSSHCHVARCICRRAERNLVSFNQIASDSNEFIISYLNRLSDYLFTLSRKVTADDGSKELKWQPKQ